MALIGVDPAPVSNYILSHAHYDHFGGLLPFLQKNRDRLPPELTLYVGGEDTFCRRFGAGPKPGDLSDFGVLDRRELAALKVRVVMCPTPTVIAGQAFTTGAIERASFERVLPNTLVEYAPKDGLGCDIPDAAQRAQGKPIADEHLGEHATCFNLKDRGLVVISSCGHRGIVNSTRQAMKVSGVNKVHAIIGGFHLFPADDAYLRQTVAELKALNPDVMIPMHCSGPGLALALRESMPTQFVAVDERKRVHVRRVRAGRLALAAAALVAVAAAAAAGDAPPRAHAARLMNELMGGRVPIGTPFSLPDQHGRRVGQAQWHRPDRAALLRLPVLPGRLPDRPARDRRRDRRARRRRDIGAAGVRDARPRAGQRGDGGPIRRGLPSALRGPAR